MEMTLSRRSQRRESGIRRQIAMKNLKRPFVFLEIRVASNSMLRAQTYWDVGYYLLWPRTTFPFLRVQGSPLTHTNHIFAWPNSDRTISSGEMNVDTALINTTPCAIGRIIVSEFRMLLSFANTMSFCHGENASRQIQDLFVSSMVDVESGRQTLRHQLKPYMKEQ